MNRHKITLGILLVAVRAFSFTIDAVVKVHSYDCSNEVKRFAGSGLLFKKGNDVYVVTSEHVVLHSNQNTCHKVFNESLKIQEAELVRADWGMGLAILRIKGPVSVTIPNESFLNATLPEANEPVTAYGFAYASKVLSQNNTATVLIARSGRGLIPLLPEMLEVQGGFVEYGMSGGPVVSNETKQFTGILSHQALKLVSAHPSQVVTINSEVPQSNHFFVIPADAVKVWVRTVLEDEPQSLPSALRDAQIQLQGDRNIVFTSGMSFELEGTDGGGPVGGPEGAGRKLELHINQPEKVDPINAPPVGGPEGAGIVGGKEQHSQSKSRFQQVIVSLDNRRHRAEWRGEANKGWMDRLKSILLKNQTVRVPYFVKYNSKRTAAKRVFFQSVSEFFTLLGNDQLQPVILRENQNPSAQQSTASVINLLDNQSKIYLRQLESLREKVKNQANQDAGDVIEQLSLLGELLRTRDYESIDNKWITSLRSSKDTPGWKHLFSVDFESTVEQLASLMVLSDLLEQLTPSK